MRRGGLVDAVNADGRTHARRIGAAADEQRILPAPPTSSSFIALEKFAARQTARRMEADKLRCNGLTRGSMQSHYRVTHVVGENLQLT